ncbi:MAG: hypothetical protein U9Q76_00015, partial [candidate division WOR-3 bacterium]|nr:hypothetical protein [candidate division WOR-3 bacterium]
DVKGDTMTSFIAEEPPKETPTLWTPLSPIGNKIVLLYHNNPEGLHAQVFDPLGRKVDEIESPSPNPSHQGRGIS